jgi:hypothetical protein
LPPPSFFIATGGTIVMRKRIILLVVLGALATASAALAFAALSGASGSTSGNFSTSVTSAPAITIAANGTVPALDAGQTVAAPIKVTNVASVSETLTSTATATFTTTPSTCATFLSYTGQVDTGQGSNLLSSGHVYTAAETHTEAVDIALAANAPSTCAGGTWTATFTATTNP